MQRANPGIATPGKRQCAGTTSTNQLIVDQVRRHPDQMQIAFFLAQDLVPGSERNQMGKAFQRDALAVMDMLSDDFLKAVKLHLLFHFCLRLLALVLRKVVERADGLARGTRSFPAAERLIAGPGAGRSALRTIDVGDSGLDVFKEEGRIFVIAVATGSQTEWGI